MNIPIKMNKDFERALATIDAKYGEDFEIFHKKIIVHWKENGLIFRIICHIDSSCADTVNIYLGQMFIVCSCGEKTCAAREDQKHRQNSTYDFFLKNS